MLTALLYVLLLALVAALLFLLSAVVFGRGEELTALPRRVRAAEPAPGPVTGETVRALRFTLAFRGYRQAEVDRALARLAAEIDMLRAAETAALPADRADADGGQSPADAEPETAERGPADPGR